MQGKKHIFLTGEKHVGKSTAIQNYLKLKNPKLGGFYTKKTDTAIENVVSVHILAAGTDDTPCEQNVLFYPFKGRGDSIERFNVLGSAILAASGDAELIIMDELGPHEEKAELFRNAVLRVLDGDVPVLGVLQMAKSGFLKTIADRPDVEVITVTEDNRDRIPEYLSEKL